MRTIERHLQQCINRIEKWVSHNGFKGQGSRMAKIGPVSGINEIWIQDRRRSPEIENVFLKHLT